ncbi:MAG: hypothetical protein WBC82_11370 [Dehalococcoidia bacterium]
MTSTRSQQFGVVAQVEIVPPFADGIRVNPDVTPGVPQTRVDWRIRKGIGGSQPAEATVVMYNLAQSSRSTAAGELRRIIDFSDEFAFLDGRLVTGADLGGEASVSAGTGFGRLKVSARYSGSSATARLFDGTLSFARSRRVGGNTWVTTAQGSDGIIQDTSAIADKFWGSDVSAPEVLDYLVRRVMVAELATEIPQALAKYTFAGGYDATNIYATDILDQLTKLTRTQWWWDDGAVYITDVGKPLPGPPIIVSSKSEPGARLLIDKPERTEDNQVVCPMLLSPDVRPNTLIRIRSNDLGGDHVVNSVEHRGQNRGSRSVCRTIATCTPLGVVGFL